MLPAAEKAAELLLFYDLPHSASLLVKNVTIASYDANSIRINNQRHICFVWTESGAEKVEIVDYHQGKNMDRLNNIHPGEILLEEFLKPMNISQNKLAQAIGVPPHRINEIVLGKRAITADTALRLSKAFGHSVQFWMGLQDEYEIRKARQSIQEQLERVMPVAA